MSELVPSHCKKSDYDIYIPCHGDVLVELVENKNG